MHTKNDAGSLKKCKNCWEQHYFWCYVTTGAVQLLQWTCKPKVLCTTVTLWTQKRLMRLLVCSKWLTFTKDSTGSGIWLGVFETIFFFFCRAVTTFTAVLLILPDGSFILEFLKTAIKADKLNTCNFRWTEDLHWSVVIYFFVFNLNLF